MAHSLFPKLSPSVPSGASSQKGRTIEPGLYLVSTPIGNLEDITLRALRVLAQVDGILCEDQRVTKKLLTHYGIRARLVTYNDHNGPKIRPRLLNALREGQALALVSDAGTPLLSDPGFKLVRALRDEKIPLHALPGPSAIPTALILSGLPPDRFLFSGFFPHKKNHVQTILEDLRTINATFIFFETGPRIVDTLAVIAEAFPNRRIAVAREMTKLHEEVLCGTAQTVGALLGERLKVLGEICLLIAPPSEGEAHAPEPDDLLRQVEEKHKTMSFAKACASVAKQYGLSRREVYSLGLGRRQEEDERP